MRRTSFNEGWFVAEEASSGAPVGPVTVPYDAMLFEPRNARTPNGFHTGFFPGGVYRYSKTFVAPEEWRDQHVLVEFEGVYLRSEVFLNGRLIGGRPSGYAEFTVPLHGGLEFGTDNVLEVVAHNDRLPNSRWYSGSGIYRPVHLLVGPQAHIAPEGPRFTTEAVQDGSATVGIATRIVNDGAVARSVTISTVLVLPSGARVGPVMERIRLAPGESTTVRQTAAIVGAALWSPETPHLHTGTVRLLGGEELLDEAAAEFGIRTLTADSRHGLRLNGVPVKLRGACIHHDNGPIGAHTLDAAEHRRVRILKESGYNAIRSAHNPVSRATLRACDRLGVLVMDELTDVWWRTKQPFDYGLDFEEWWERDLEAMILKDVNHPSVIMYSIGNEIAETATPRGVRLSQAMAGRARDLDPTRLVTNGINGFLNLIASMNDEKVARKAEAARARGESFGKNLIVVLNHVMGVLEKVLPHLVRLPRVDRRTRDAFAALDVAGYNYMAGRYRKDTQRYPDRLIVGTETNPPDTARVWREIEALPQVLGEFAWTGWDYVGEAGIAAIEYDQPRRLFKPYPALLAGEPVIDITGFAQPQAYLNQVAWRLRTDPYIAVHEVQHSGRKRVSNSWRSGNVVHSWSWEGFEGTAATVEVYADAARVDLVLNGAVVGSASIGAQQAFTGRFTVVYRPGELAAIAYDETGTEIGRDVLRSTSEILRLRLEPETEGLIADGSDLLYVPISLTDDDGRVKPLADRLVDLHVDGAATLLGFGSAQPITAEAFTGTSHSTYRGRALAVLRAGHAPGDVTITATAQGCDPVSVTVPVRRPGR
ncbi:glycoside hydrolase family 2 TIM barrel-domain containing protein [Cryptosporangium aurantiacum]|uniref:Glycosyl hydrolases family 2 n=1 Tax=Cryptosporangium aurantiacum TaxID=134849 RepID=A0A1M7R3N4_9ACTN|nr:glycoside hydrolase family 2 TIM barrel-domain containing protein [Cryptosporangium aurantiacum]SHN39510.1 Glycosyl hydrolases family 2 [Cryptosporangium aurantiacum]